MEIPYAVQPRRDTGLYNSKVGIWLFLASEVMLFGAFFSAYILLRVGAPEGTWPAGLLNIPIGTFNTAVLILSSWTVIMSWASLKMKKFTRFKIFQAMTVLCALTFLGVKSYEYHEKFIHYEVWLKQPVQLKRDGKEIEVTRLTGHIDGNPMFLTLAKVQAKGLEHVKFEAEPFHYAENKLAARGNQGAHHEEMEIEVSNIKRLSAYVPAHSTYFAVYFTMTFLHGLHVLGGAIVMAYFFFTGDKMWKTDPERLTNRIEVSGLFWHFVDLVWIFLFPVLYLL
jgi:cytochrome c oxidase subunit 3